MMLHTLIFLASGLSLGTVSASKPGKMLPLLEPHPHRAKRSVVPRTLLRATTKAIPASPVIDISLPGLKRGIHGLSTLQSRSVACQDSGFSVCSDQLKCCPVGEFAFSRVAEAVQQRTPAFPTETSPPILRPIFRGIMLYRR